MDANIASGETPPGVESDNSKNAIMCAECGKVENFFDAQDAGWEIQENLEYICNECIAKKKATADDKKEGDNSKNAEEEVISNIVNNANSQVDNEETNRYIEKRLEDLEYNAMNYDDANYDIDYIRKRLREEYEEDDKIYIEG